MAFIKPFKHCSNFMRLKSFITLNTVLLAAIFVVSCSKVAKPPVAETKIKDFGVIEFSANTPTHLNLDSNQDCVITARPDPNGIRLSVMIQTTNNEGTLTQTNLPEVTPLSGMRTYFSVNGVTFKLTPKLVQ